MQVFKIGLLVGAVVVAQQPEERKPVRKISIVAERFTFNPSRVTVKQGELIEFVLQSDDTDHGFKISSAGIDVAIPPIGKGEVSGAIHRDGEGHFSIRMLASMWRGSRFDARRDRCSIGGVVSR